MTHPIGYFCDQNLPLISEAEHYWGSYFQGLTQSEKLWMLSTLTGVLTADKTENYDPYDVSDDITPMCESLHNLEYEQQLALARFLLNTL